MNLQHFQHLMFHHRERMYPFYDVSVHKHNFTAQNEIIESNLMVNLDNLYLIFNDFLTF